MDELSQKLVNYKERTRCVNIKRKTKEFEKELQEKVK
jgi:hypothetical protein